MFGWTAILPDDRELLNMDGRVCEGSNGSLSLGVCVTNSNDCIVLAPGRISFLSLGG